MHHPDELGWDLGGPWAAERGPGGHRQGRQQWHSYGMEAWASSLLPLIGVVLAAGHWRCFVVSTRRGLLLAAEAASDESGF
jgi:hypothetical protein